jgi:drug/metabolite transporter (DMT)-like permease
LGGVLRRHRHWPRIVPAASLFAALRFGLIAFLAIFFVPRPDVRWMAVVDVGLFICVGQFGLLFVAMNTGLPAGLASVIAPLQPVFTIPLAARSSIPWSATRTLRGRSGGYGKQPYEVHGSEPRTACPSSRRKAGARCG